MRRLGKRGGGGLLAIVVTGMTLWGMGALSYAALPALLHSVLAATCGLAPAGALLGLSHRRRTLLGFVLVWGALVGWWSTITPSNARAMRTCAPRPRVVRDTMRETSVVILLRSVGYA